MESKKMLFLALVSCVAIATAIYSQFPFQTKKKIGRTPEYADIDSLFIERWSPRAMSGEPISDSELMPLFEAARWAPSSYNEQPWRFLFAKRDTPEWATFFDFLVPFNQEWCKNGAVLVVICSKNPSDRGGLNPLHTFDTGAAWQNLALQGHLKGFVVHGMGGFDREKARSNLGIPDDFSVEAMAVIGKPGDPKNLPDYMRKNEEPSGRKAIKEIVCEGSFTFKE